MVVELWPIFLAAISSFIITYLTIPSVIDLAFTKNLFDSPNERKVHTRQIPSLGGIGIFIGVLISFTFFSSVEVFGTYKYILTAFLLLFFMGLKDDLIPMEAKIKLILQVLAAFILAVGGIRITSLHGLFGVNELNLWMSYALTIFFIVGVTNAFNLIDGIDGLAGGLGGINCLTLGSLLLWVEEYNYAVLAFAITGSLLAFLRYNFGAYPNKIFMGDAGSLLLGLTVTILCIQFMEAPLAFSKLSIISPLGIVGGIVFIPVFDTLRVFTLRLSRGVSPFSPDKSHIHHELLDSGLSHKNSSFLLYLGNAALIINVLFFKSQTALFILFSCIVVGVIFVHGLILWRYTYSRKKEKQLNQKLTSLKKENSLI